MKIALMRKKSAICFFSIWKQTGKDFMKIEIRRRLLTALLAIFASIFLNAPALAENHAGKAGNVDLGVAVSHDYSDEFGNVVRVTVIPPVDRAVDLRFFEGWGFAHDGNKEVKTLESTVPQESGAPETLIDLSGYEVVIEPLAIASDCSAGFKAPRLKPALLGPGKTFMVSSTSPEAMFAVTFPTQGNVDVTVADDTRVCSSSSNGPGTMDVAGCYFPNCSNSSKVLRSRFKNPSATAQAKFTAIVNITFISTSIF
jgi:hypothetical protein